MSKEKRRETEGRPAESNLFLPAFSASGDDKGPRIHKVYFLFKGSSQEAEEKSLVRELCLNCYIRCSMRIHEVSTYSNPS